MTFLTDFADQAVMLPLALAIGIALFMQGWRRGAAAWAVAVLATFAAMLALKVLFLACSGSFGTPDVRTPSGHVAAATVVAGGLAVLLLRWRHAALLVAAMAAGVIGISRLALHMHSPAEVMIGASVGLAGAWTLLLLAGRPPPDLNGRRIAVIAVAVVVLFHGLHLPAEAHIRGSAWRLAQMLSVCQSPGVRL
ncbi:MAG TPA: phosphatase PAP2 family protein [Acetobacteraceae bacterium]